MNFNVYLDDALARRLDDAARRKRLPRNALVRSAVAAWLEREAAPWPDAVLRFTGDASATPFEAHRGELEEPVDDPLALGSRPTKPRRRRR